MILNLNMNTNEINKEGNVITFDYNNHKVRTIIKDAETWWILKDVCEVLDINNSKMVAARLENDEKSKVSQTDLRNNNFEIPNRGLTIINEPGLYKVMLRSDKPKAKKFMRWITHEVLPSIRRHGAYMTDEVLKKTIHDPRFLIELLEHMQQQKEENRKMKAQIDRDSPKVIFADAVNASDDSISIGDLSKILKANGVDIGRNILFAQLRKLGFLISKGQDYNRPTQRAMNLKLFTIKETAITHSDGRIITSLTPKVTGKGQVYFVNRFKRHFVPQESENGAED